MFYGCSRSARAPTRIACWTAWRHVERLHRIERILGTDLGSAESRTSLHVALLALESAASG
jgi:PucR C-terminal helix-turn-helix domain